ncbi:unnamed protein product [Cladocopium goreaui]|uniref:Uncharacterized protein slr0889 n=1 Tax=Cladocopium goreaui TaxID=2562237 RepID=A0A9P1FKW6_9DINO|nr:unnamed protein product [Cladocopium goreaui]
MAEQLQPTVRPPSWARRSIPVPLNGPRLARLLYEVHGYEIFQLGLFNSDPHAGNVFMMPDGKLGLIDYGACMRLTEEQRSNIAHLLIAIADEDDEAVRSWLIRLSNGHVCGAAAFWGPKWETPAVLAMKLDNDHAQKGFKRSFGDPLDPDEAVMPHKGLTVTFLTDEDKEVDVFFRKAPLGFRMAHKQAPLKVANINDKGCVVEDKLDVRPGWILKAVNGNSLTNCHQKVGAQIVKDAIKEAFGLGDREEEKEASRSPLQEGAKSTSSVLGLRLSKQEPGAPAAPACQALEDPRLALLLAHVFFNRGPYAYDMNRLALKVGMPVDADIMTLDSYLRGGELDDIEEFPGHLVMLQRCAMVLSGLALELGAGRLSSAEMLKPQAKLWLQQ